jgi:hypothetical protein
MKRIFTILFVTALTGISACAQDNAARPSPPAKATGKAGNATITIDYSQPSVKGRKIFGDLVPYGKVWRTGANEATVFETDSDIKVEGKPLAKGKYGFFTVPGENEWTIVFNKTWNQWGAFRYVQEDDVLRVQVKPTKGGPLTEMMKISVESGKVKIAWENTTASFTVTQ